MALNGRGKGLIMYHYTECGLDNVWLKNGYQQWESKDGLACAVHDVDALHKVIANSVVSQDAPLTGKELRFLRIELDLSQKSLGQVLGRSEPQVANWEKGKTDVPVLVDASVRQLYNESRNSESRLSDLLKKLSVLDRRLHELQIALEETDEGWRYELRHCA